MDVVFDSDLHKDLYTWVRSGDRQVLDAAWTEFAGKHLEMEPFRERWVTSRLSGTTPLSQHVPWINYPAIDFLASLLGRNDTVFEWGMGGSTIWLAERCKTVVSVEHDRKWFELASKVIASHCDSVGYKLSCLLGLRAKPSLKLIESVKGVNNPKYGSGAKGYATDDFEAYVNAIQEFDNETFSLVLVDGRSRIAALQAALSKVKRGGWLMLDNSDYARYQPSLAELRKLELAGWTERPFYGPGPHSAVIGWKTTAFRRP